MPTLTPDMVGNALWVMIIAYLATFAYSIYSLILNHKQAKVKDTLEKTNKILFQQNIYLQTIISELKRKK